MKMLRFSRLSGILQRRSSGMAKSMGKEKVTTAQQQVDAWATQNRKNSE